MGEAKQRKLALTAGRPWAGDGPPTTPSKPEGIVMIPSPEPTTSSLIATLELPSAVRQGPKMLLIDDVRRRRSSNIAIIMSLLDSSGDPLITFPRKTR
jgi:hypothetical protein